MPYTDAKCSSRSLIAGSYSSHCWASFTQLVGTKTAPWTQVQPRRPGASGASAAAEGDAVAAGGAAFGAAQPARTQARSIRIACFMTYREWGRGAAAMPNSALPAPINKWHQGDLHRSIPISHEDNRTHFPKGDDPQPQRGPGPRIPGDHRLCGLQPDHEGCEVPEHSG